MSDYEDNKLSRFNAGVALTERIDALQRAINAARFNPLATNPETMTMNYENMIAANDALFYEAWGKLKDDERELGQRIQKIIKRFLETNPPINKDANGKMQINKNNYKKLLELINFYERKNKEFLDGHNLNAPNFEDDDDML